MQYFFPISPVPSSFLYELNSKVISNSFIDNLITKYSNQLSKKLVDFRNNIDFTPVFGATITIHINYCCKKTYKNFAGALTFRVSEVKLENDLKTKQIHVLPISMNSRCLT